MARYGARTDATPERIALLPAWARDYITRLQHQLDIARGRIAALEGGRIAELEDRVAALEVLVATGRTRNRNRMVLRSDGTAGPRK